MELLLIYSHNIWWNNENRRLQQPEKWEVRIVCLIHYYDVLLFEAISVIQIKCRHFSHQSLCWSTCVVFSSFFPFEFRVKISWLEIWSLLFNWNCNWNRFSNALLWWSRWIFHWPFIAENYLIKYFPSVSLTKFHKTVFDDSALQWSIDLKWRRIQAIKTSVCLTM